VDLIEVDAIGLQAPQARLDRADDPVARGAAAVGPAAHGEAELGGEDDLVAAAAIAEPPADHPLREAVLAVDVGGVEEVDALAEGAVHDLKRGLLVAADLVHERALVGLAEGHRPEAERRDLEAGAAELAVFHGDRVPPGRPSRPQ